MLKVTLYETPADPQPVEVEVDYVSLVSPETYGPPALIAPVHRPADAGTARAPKRAVVGESVLYINTRLVPVWEIERTTD